MGPARAIAGGEVRFIQRGRPKGGAEPAMTNLLSSQGTMLQQASRWVAASSLRRLRRGAADALARHDQLHDSRSAVADFETHHIAQPLLMRQILGPSIVPEREQALMDDVEGGLRSHPLDHRGFGGVRQPGVAQGDRVIAELADGGDLALAPYETKPNPLLG